jgi:L-ribulokinase
MSRFTLGLDFGTESVRALLVDLRGKEAGSAVARYRHGQILEHLPGNTRKLPRDFALQHPDDWLQSSAKATLHPCQHGPALGAAILGALAAGTKTSGFSSIENAVKAMALPRGVTIRTARPAKRGYDEVYAEYRALASGNGL